MSLGIVVKTSYGLPEQTIYHADRAPTAASHDAPPRGERGVGFHYAVE